MRFPSRTFSWSSLVATPRFFLKFKINLPRNSSNSTTASSKSSSHAIRVSFWLSSLSILDASEPTFWSSAVWFLWTIPTLTPRGFPIAMHFVFVNRLFKNSSGVFFGALLSWDRHFSRDYGQSVVTFGGRSLSLVLIDPILCAVLLPFTIADL